MARECGRRPESLFMTPCFLNPITCATNIKPFEYPPKEKPAQGFAGFSLNKLEDKLETPGGTDNL